TFASKQLSGMVVMSWILGRHLRVILLRAILLDQRSCISYSSVASIKNLNGTFKRSREIIDQIFSDKDRYVSPSQTSRGPVYMLKSVTVTALSLYFMGVAAGQDLQPASEWAA